MLELVPITFREANAFIKKHHRHHGIVRGCKFCIGVADEFGIVGVVTVGRPVSRNLDNGWTAEITRCCTDGTPHAASKLYAAAFRAARAMGYKRVITYTLKSEKGTSLIAAGWEVLYETKGGGWSRASRPRVDTHPTGQKLLWEAGGM
jgi:hypothetical protein